MVGPKTVKSTGITKSCCKTLALFVYNWYTIQSIVVLPIAEILRCHRSSASFSFLSRKLFHLPRRRGKTAWGSFWCPHLFFEGGTVYVISSPTNSNLSHPFSVRKCRRVAERFLELLRWHLIIPRVKRRDSCATTLPSALCKAFWYFGYSFQLSSDESKSPSPGRGLWTS